MNATESSPRGLQDVPLSALLLATRGVYTAAVRRAQAKIGCTDVPASGEFILNAMEWTGASIEPIVRWLGVSKQAVSQSVDQLVVRGYLERARDPDDRRRVKLVLTARGHAAGRAAKAAIQHLDRQLQARVGAASIAHTRVTLAALAELKRAAQRRQEGA